MKILLPKELHLLHLLNNNVIFKVRVGSSNSEEIAAIIGIIEGDCLSAVLFSVYLAKAFDGNYSFLSYERDLKEVTIEPKYTDDITYVSPSKPKIKDAEVTLPKNLKDFNLGVNHRKTERYECPDPPNTT